MTSNCFDWHHLFVFWKLSLTNGSLSREIVDKQKNDFRILLFASVGFYCKPAVYASYTNKTTKIYASKKWSIP